tara:strand:+ start:9132 stop:9554 length:423 start_codon:yes stop_codon:yes gene_type:complete
MYLINILNSKQFKKNFLKLKFFFFIFGFLFGVIWYRQDLFPRPFIRAVYRNTLKDINKDGFRINKDWENTNLTFSKYTKGLPLFLDRSYIDTVGDNRLEGLFLKQIRRHQKENIILETKSPIYIYRIIPKRKDVLNNKYV